LTGGSERFSGSQRLKKASEFARVFAEPQRSTDEFFVVLARRNDTDTARLGLAISRRAARLAVERNRLKRLVREVFRAEPALPPWDFVVMAKAPARSTDNVALRGSLHRHFARLCRRAALPA
jgi:ribonuclease P protein component